jgi:DNA-binding NarL/FixJ family response regulator
MPVDRRRVLVVEDEPLMASLLAEVLTNHGFEVLTAANVSEARREIDRFDPDLLVLDVALGDGPTGVHLANALRLSRPDIAILVFTGTSERGADLPPGVGLLRKHQVTDERYLLEAIEKVLGEQAGEIAQVERAEDLFSFLGANGSRVFRLLAEGHNNVEIATRCDVSAKTVERWVERIYRDLGIDTKGSLNPRVEAARQFYLSVGVPNSTS